MILQRYISEMLVPKCQSRLVKDHAKIVPSILRHKKSKENIMVCLKMKSILFQHLLFILLYHSYSLGI